MSNISRVAADARQQMILREVAHALRSAHSGITNIQAVIAAAKLAPEDIDDAFGDTRGLVIALVEMLAARMLEPLVDETTPSSFQQKLHAFGHRVTEDHVALQLRCLYRIALTEVIRNTGVGSDVYRHGPGLVTAGLARFFEAARQAGVALEEDCHHLASHLMALLRSSADLRDSHAAGEATRLRAHVSRTIASFCAGIQMEAEDAQLAV